MTSRFPPFAFVELVSPYNKKNITRWREDMNFMFEWQEQYIWLGAIIKAGVGEEIGAGAALPLTVVLPTKACKTAMPGGGTWYSQSPYPIIVYSMANYRPHHSHF